MTKECEFLREYEKLCQKYSMGLIGCGCCGSPHLNDIDDINYNKKLNKVFINGSGFWHEKYQCVEECEPIQDYQSDGLYLFTRITEKYDKWLNAIIEIIKE